MNKEKIKKILQEIRKSKIVQLIYKNMLNIFKELNKDKIHYCSKYFHSEYITFKSMFTFEHG